MDAKTNCKQNPSKLKGSYSSSARSYGLETTFCVRGTFAWIPSYRNTLYN